MNSYSRKLEVFEAESIMKDTVLMNRALKSFELILDFFGLEFENPETGELKKKVKNFKKFIKFF